MYYLAPGVLQLDRGRGISWTNDSVPAVPCVNLLLNSRRRGKQGPLETVVHCETSGVDSFLCSLSLWHQPYTAYGPLTAGVNWSIS